MMKIGSQQDIARLYRANEEIAAEMPERIRRAHDQASAEQAGATATAPVSAPINALGAELRTELEAIVEEVVVGPATKGADLIERVLDRIVEHRLEGLDLGLGDEIRRGVTEQMGRDPTVVQELDDLLRCIARDLALG